jgi:hypothetical protein
MKKTLLEKVPWLWIAILVLSALVLLQYFQIIELRRTLYATFDGISAGERSRAIMDERVRSHATTNFQ